MKIFRLPYDYCFQFIPSTDTHSAWKYKGFYKRYRVIYWGYWMFRLWGVKW
jgi:hypothetical protein